MSQFPTPSINGQALYDFARFARADFKLDNLGNQILIDCTGANAVSIQATVIEGAWGSAVLTVERSNTGDPLEWYALSTPVTINSDGITDIIPTTNYLRVYVTTAGSANDRVRIAASARLS